MSDTNDIEVKTEPVDIADPPKDFLLVPGTTFAEDGECEDLQYFTQVEVDNTRKCLENTRLIIKDFETQLDWHLQQYITLRNIFNKKADGSKRQDLLSISQLSAIIANHPEGNKKFIKRKGPVSNGGAGRKRKRSGRKGKDSEEEETEEEDDDETEDSEDYDEEDSDSENEDNPKRTRGRKGDVQVKDEIEEEYNELVVPKEEPNSEDEDEDFDEDEMDDEDFDEEDDYEAPPKKGKGKATPAKKTPAPAKKAPAKKAPAKAKATPAKTTKAAAGAKKGAAAKAKAPAKGKGRGKNKQVANDDDEDEEMPEIKDEIDSNEISEKLQNKFIFDVDEFEIDEEKPIILLTDENYKTFDWNEVKLNNVIITFDEQFPDFIFSKDVAKNILNDNIKVVEVGVFDMYNDTKN